MTLRTRWPEAMTSIITARPSPRRICAVFQPRPTAHCPGPIRVDIGGGTGAVSEQLLDRDAAASSPGSLAGHAAGKRKRRCPQWPRSCVRRASSLQRRCVRTIICSSVLHHLPYPDRMLGEIKRALAPYGVVLCRSTAEPFSARHDPVRRAASAWPSCTTSIASSAKCRERAADP